MWEWFTPDSSDPWNSQSESHSAKGLWCCINGAALWCVCHKHFDILFMWWGHEQSLGTRNGSTAWIFTLQTQTAQIFFHYRKALWFVESLLSEEHFPKKIPRYSNTEFCFENWMLGPTASLMKLPPGTEVPTWWELNLPSFCSIPLHSSYCVSVSWCCTEL